MSLITPRTISNSTPVHPLTSNHNGTHKSTNHDDNEAPKVDTAPPLLQLPLSREETFTAISRCSTIFEDKIGIEIIPGTPKTSVPKTPKKRTRSRPSITRQSNRSRRSVSSDNGRQNRKQPTLTVKSLDKSKNKYVKYAKAVFKDAGVVYKRKIKLGGKVQKRRPSAPNKTLKLNNVTKDKIETNITEKTDSYHKTLPDAMYAFDMVKELKRPKDAVVEVEKIEIEPPKEEIKPPSPKFIYDDKDDNFFMCSNDEDNSYKEFMEKRKQEHEAEVKLKNSFRNKNRLPTKVPFVDKWAKNEKLKSEDKRSKPSGFAKMLKNVESVARFSVLRQKFGLPKKKKESKSSREAEIEQNVLSKVFYNNDNKTKSKIQHRNQRLQRAVNISRNFERIPTLVNWVECSDILFTPAMRMQSKIKNDESKYDSVRNEKFANFK